MAEEPEEGDLVTSDHRTVYEVGRRRPVLSITERQSFTRQVRLFMNREKFWPNVWFISDHGNAHLIDLSAD